MKTVKGKELCKRSKRMTKFNSDWLLRTDQNGDKVASYLRPVPGDPHHAFCAIDSTKLRVSTRGWAQINDHVMSEIHQSAMKNKKSQKLVGTYQEHHLADRTALNTFYMRLLLFCNEHGVALENYDCLVKCVKQCCPDSKIARSVKALNRKSCTVKLRYGIAKTELEQTLEEIRKIEFSAVLDAGTKGNKKRTEFLVRYWSETEKKIIEKFLKASTTNKETLAVVVKNFLDMLQNFDVPQVNLVNMKCDSCAILRGKKNGAMKKIAVPMSQSLM